jgi:hypothetical protein
MLEQSPGIRVDSRLNNPWLYGALGGVAGGMAGSLLADFRDLRRRRDGKEPVNRNKHIITGALLGAVLTGLGSKALGPSLPGTVLRTDDDIIAYINRRRKPQPEITDPGKPHPNLDAKEIEARLKEDLKPWDTGGRHLLPTLSERIKVMLAPSEINVET